MSERRISHSEVTTLLDCQAKHDFRYVGQLAGSALKSKDTPILLREGKAWGRAVAEFHAADSNPLNAGLDGLAAALLEDAEEQVEHGLYDPDQHRALEAKLQGVFTHYAATSEQLAIDRLEHELLVAFPSRSGKGKSNRYKLQAFLDGLHVDPDGRVWIVEFKLRKRLTALELIASNRQLRRYAWAYREATGIEVAGVIVDERLNAEPSQVALNKNGSPSKRQSCTAEEYIAAGGEDEEVITGLRAKKWQQRERVFLTHDEVVEAGLELTSLGRQVQALDSGEFYPVRNPSQMRCPGCQFKDICPNPSDTELVEALFERATAKRDREEVAA